MLDTAGHCISLTLVEHGVIIRYAGLRGGLLLYVLSRHVLVIEGAYALRAVICVGEFSWLSQHTWLAPGAVCGGRCGLIDAARPAVKRLVWSWLRVLGLVVSRLPTLLLLYHCVRLSLPLLCLWLLCGNTCKAANRGSILRVQSSDGPMHRRLCSTFDTLPTRVHLRDIVHLRISCHGPIGGRSISPSR